MRNPLRSEAEAFHFLILTIAAFAVIAIASALGGWKAGLPVFVVTTAAAIRFFFRQQGEQRPRPLAPTGGAEGERRILVVANETVGGTALRETIREKVAGSRAEVLVVAPALNSPLKHWVSDEDGARAAARSRLDDSLARLAQAEIQARGEVGDAEPLQAIEDALRGFPADEIVISTHPEGRSTWLEKRLVEEARQRFAVPITHVVVDLDAGD